MSRHPSPLDPLWWLAVAAAASCADPGAGGHYAPYHGEAFPNRHAPLRIPAAGLGIVPDSRSDTLSLVDLGTGEKLATARVGRDPVGTDGPHHVAVDPGAGAIFTALSYPAYVAAGIHGSHGGSPVAGYVQKLSLDDLRILGEARVDSNPGDIVLSEDGRRLVVSHFDLQRAAANPGDLEKGRAMLAVLDPASVGAEGAPPALRVPVCIGPHGVALSRPDGARAYVACYGEDSIAVVDLAAADPASSVRRIPVAATPGLPGAPSYGPYSAVLSPDGSTIAIGNTISKDVRFFDVALSAVDGERTLPFFGAPFFPAWSPDGQTLFVPTQAPDALHRVRLADGTVESRTFSRDECERPHVVEVHDAETIFLVCEGDGIAPGHVLRIDASSLATLTSTEVGVFPDAMARVAPPGGG